MIRHLPNRITYGLIDIPFLHPPTLLSCIPLHWALEVTRCIKLSPTARRMFTGIHSSHLPSDCGTSYRSALWLPQLLMPSRWGWPARTNYVQPAFSSPEPKAHLWAYRIRRPPSFSVVICRPSSSTPLNIFSLDTTGPVEVKFHMELLWDQGTKVFSNGPGRMIKVAAMPIYGQDGFQAQEANALETWYTSSGTGLKYYQIC